MYPENHFSADFVKYYHSDVRPAAEKVANLYPQWLSAENKGVAPAENDPLVIALNKLTDSNAVWYVGQMIGEIDRHIIKGIRLGVLNVLNGVYGCLTSESYWTNVWKNDKTSEEAQNLLALAEKMKVLVKKLDTNIA